MQLDGMVLATFASLIAPFGGFFASGLKRTFKIKDFGDSIPGHGGMTDRMDCQFIMGFFAYMYYHTFIAVYKVTLGSVIETAITSQPGRAGRACQGHGAVSRKPGRCAGKGEPKPHRPPTSGG